MVGKHSATCRLLFKCKEAFESSLHTAGRGFGVIENKEETQCIHGDLAAIVYLYCITYCLFACLYSGHGRSIG